MNKINTIDRFKQVYITLYIIGLFLLLAYERMAFTWKWVMQGDTMQTAISRYQGGDFGIVQNLIIIGLLVLSIFYLLKVNKKSKLQIVNNKMIKTSFIFDLISLIPLIVLLFVSLTCSGWCLEILIPAYVSMFISPIFFILSYVLYVVGVSKQVKGY